MATNNRFNAVSSEIKSKDSKSSNSLSKEVEDFLVGYANDLAEAFDSRLVAYVFYMEYKSETNNKEDCIRYTFNVFRKGVVPGTEFFYVELRGKDSTNLIFFNYLPENRAFASEQILENLNELENKLSECLTLQRWKDEFDRLFHL